MKKFRLIIGALVMSLLALIVSVPSQAAPRSVVMPQIQNEVVKNFDLQEPVSDIVCPAMIFRNINDYAFTSVRDVTTDTVTETRITERFDLLYFPATSFQTAFLWINGKSPTINETVSKRRGFRLTNKQPLNSVFANRKNKSSPVNQ